MAKKTDQEISKLAHEYLEKADPADSLMQSITRRMLFMFAKGYEIAQHDEALAWQAGYDEALKITDHRIQALQAKLWQAIKNELIND